jgi:hypothetical protein
MNLKEQYSMIYYKVAFAPSSYIYICIDEDNFVVSILAVILFNNFSLFFTFFFHFLPFFEDSPLVFSWIPFLPNLPDLPQFD